MALHQKEAARQPREGADSRPITSSRPDCEVLKILTVPLTIRNIPAQGSPSQNSMSPAAYRRSISSCVIEAISLASKPENSDIPGNMLSLAKGTILVWQIHVIILRDL